MPNSTKPDPVFLGRLSDAARALTNAKQRRLELILEARALGMSNDAIGAPLGLSGNGVRMIVQRAQ